MTRRELPRDGRSRRILPPLSAACCKLRALRPARAQLTAWLLHDADPAAHFSVCLQSLAELRARFAGARARLGGRTGAAR
jgi:hypothetical protein